MAASHSTHEHVVDTACPLDCPDSCSLSVATSGGRVVSLDGSRLNPVTDGFICAKVRRFGERVTSPLRIMHPAVRTGPEGQRGVLAGDLGRGD